MELATLAQDQDGVFAVWQLAAAGWKRRDIVKATRRHQRLHDGVFLTGLASPTQRQRFIGATLTTPTSALADECAAVYWEYLRTEPTQETIVRPGSSRNRRIGRLHIRYSETLEGDVIRRDGMLVSSRERTVIDVFPTLDDANGRKLLREALRRKGMNVASLQKALTKHRGKRGVKRLNQLVTKYARLQIDRCRSDAEAYAMEVLDDHRRPLPEVNVKRGRYEADLSWPELKLIIEIDGDQYHWDKLLDAKKTAHWESLGWTVRRLPAKTLFADRTSLLALAPRK